MRKLVLIVLLSLVGYILQAQPFFDLGFKGGLTVPDFSISKESYSAENILGYHAGAFARVGVGWLFLQPEAYFNARGGEIFQGENNPVNVATKFDFSTVDVPIMLGIKLLKSEAFNIRVQGGPLFSFVTSRNVEGPKFGIDDFRENFFGWQYGVGIDLWFITLDARFENSRGSVIETSDFNVVNNIFVVSAGIKIF